MSRVRGTFPDGTLASRRSLTKINTCRRIDKGRVGPGAACENEKGRASFRTTGRLGSVFPSRAHPYVLEHEFAPQGPHFNATTPNFEETPYHHGHTTMKKLFLSLALFLCAGLCLSGNALADGAPIVEIDTTLGTIKVRLEPRKAPVTTQNFLDYVDAGFYDGTIFHRVIKGFMIQGGGYDKDMKERPTRAPIKNEASNQLRNRKYTIAMARTSAPDSATAQFFINVENNRFLDPDEAQDGVGYAVFGEVIQGKEVVDKIAGVPTSNSHRIFKDKPVEDVTILSARVVNG